jgi:hypothetical protein
MTAVQEGSPQIFPGKPVIKVLILAWLLPGGGHIYIGRRGKGVLFLLCLSFLFIVGLTLKGVIFTPGGEDTQSYLISLFGTAGDLGLGLYYLLSLLFYPIEGEIVSPHYEIGMLYTLTAGVINYLLIVDALDINHGRKP